jgi:hypothetical protein
MAKKAGALALRLFASVVSRHSQGGLELRRRRALPRGWGGCRRGKHPSLGDGVGVNGVSV